MLEELGKRGSGEYSIAPSAILEWRVEEWLHEDPMISGSESH
jgi:DNA-nicking Smr family endonuclease